MFHWMIWRRDREINEHETILQKLNYLIRSSSVPRNWVLSTFNVGPIWTLAGTFSGFESRNPCLVTKNEIQYILYANCNKDAPWTSAGKMHIRHMLSHILLCSLINKVIVKNFMGSPHRRKSTAWHFIDVVWLYRLPVERRGYFTCSNALYLLSLADPRSRGRVVYLGWSIAPKCWGMGGGEGDCGVAGSQPVSTAVHMEPK